MYEALDKSISGYSGCGVFLRNGRSSNCNINWVTGDVINGPMYTQDQFLVDGSPTFGRNANDKIESAAPGTSPADICANNASGTIQEDDCGSAVFNGTAVPNAPTTDIRLTPDGSTLVLGASTHFLRESGDRDRRVADALDDASRAPRPSGRSAARTRPLRP